MPGHASRKVGYQFTYVRVCVNVFMSYYVPVSLLIKYMKAVCYLDSIQIQAPPPPDRLALDRKHPLLESVFSLLCL